MASIGPARVAQFLDEDRVGALQQVGELAPDLAEDAHAQARPGERMPIDHFARQPEPDADLVRFFHRRLQRQEAILRPVLRELADVEVQLLG